MKITLTLPEEMIKTMGITEDTLFITSYETVRFRSNPMTKKILKMISPMRIPLTRNTTMICRRSFPMHSKADTKEELFRVIQMDTAADLKTHTKDCRITTIIAAA